MCVCVCVCVCVCGCVWCVCVCVCGVCVQSSQTTPVTQPTPYTPQPNQDADYKTGSCDFSNVALSPAKEDYYYKAVFVPGNVQKVFGPVTVGELLLT